MADSFYVWKEYKPGSHHKIRVSHALDEATVFEASHFSAGRTVLCVFGVILVPVAIAAIACAASECDFGIGAFSGN